MTYLLEKCEDSMKIDLVVITLVKDAGLCRPETQFVGGGVAVRGSLAKKRSKESSLCLISSFDGLRHIPRRLPPTNWVSGLDWDQYNLFFGVGYEVHCFICLHCGMELSPSSKSIWGWV